MDSPLPDISVIVSTYNRATQVGRAIESVLSQAAVSLELVVVDDGSTDGTPDVLAGVADPRLRCVQQRNQGLSASRNAGARAARGEWLLFLDDDDRLCEGALQALFGRTADPRCRVVLGGVRFVDPDGNHLQDRAPTSLSDALAGTFLISRTLFGEAGGYLHGMPCSHQTELFLRVGHVINGSAAAAAYVAAPVVEVERRAAGNRAQRSPANAYFGGRWLAARHPEHHVTPVDKATIETIAAVNAMRIGRHHDARRRFASAIRHDPLSPGRYLRLGAAIAAPLGRRYWLRQWDTVPEQQRPLERVRRPAAADRSAGHLPLERDPAPGPDSLFLPWRYRENRANPGDGSRRDAAVHRLAARLARAKGLSPVVDIGRIEGDVEGESFWRHVVSRRPQLLVCGDVLEHVADPRRVLSGIRLAIAGGGLALVSIVDRGRLRPELAMGPPGDRHHIREWSAEEFALLLESCGFDIVRMVRRGAGRSCVVFTVRSARSASEQLQIAELEGELAEAGDAR
jgi:glycosyltransferase involved in cell wall biosynthesis